MGYYLSVLKKGQVYELDGQKIQFVEKVGKWFYFYACKMNEWNFKYEPTDEKISFTLQQINYIKRAYQTYNNGLRKIGRDKVFPRIQKGVKNGRKETD